MFSHKPSRQRQRQTIAMTPFDERKKKTSRAIVILGDALWGSTGFPAGTISAAVTFLPVKHFRWSKY